MLHRRAFTFATFDVHVQPSLRRAFPMAGAPEKSFEQLLGQRLDALARIFDTEASRGQAAASA